MQGKRAGKSVVAEFTGEEIIDLTTARLAQGMMPDDAGVICTDTRSLCEGAWYLALPGKQYDGHDFIGDAYSCGALGCIVEERGSYPIASSSFPLIAVDNTYDAFQQLARNWRKRLNPKVVAVTGSINETSPVVDACAALLATKYEVVVHDRGTAESLLNAETALEPEVQVFIAKVCPEELAQAELLARALAPTVVVLTEDGFSHLRAANENLIARAECDLLVHLDKQRGIGIISHRSQDLMHRIKYHFPERTVKFDSSLVRLEEGGDAVTVELVETQEKFEFPNGWVAADCWSVVSVCKQLGMATSEIAKGLKSLS